MTAKFGEQYWSAVLGGKRDNSAINNGGYYDREKLENPVQIDRFGEPVDTQTTNPNWRMEFPYGY